MKALIVFLCASLGIAAVPGLAQQPKPSIAVMSFSTRGLTSDWWGNFEPGVALSDLVTDHLVNAGAFDVVERVKLFDALEEHRIDTSGTVDPETAVEAGRLIGAHFLIEGNVVQFDQTGSSGVTAGQTIGYSRTVTTSHTVTTRATAPPCYKPTPLSPCPTAPPSSRTVTSSQVVRGVAGEVVGSFGSGRVTLKVAVHVINAETGQIVEAFDDEQTQTANSWSVGGADFLTGTYGSYENANFISSTMGHLIDSEAAAIAARINAQRLFAAAPVAPSVTGYIIGIDNGYFILDVGAARGVSVGEYFHVVKILRVRDPSTGRYLTSTVPMGTLEITSVSPDTAVARRVSGTPATGQEVRSEP